MSGTGRFLDTKIIALVLALSGIAFVVGVMLPGRETQQSGALPWQIERGADGATRVFGLTLGQSTLAQAEQAFQAAAEVSLFDSPRKARAVEAYFDKVSTGGLRAKLVLVIQLPPERLQALYERGERISTLGSAERKVTLHPQDLELIRRAPIASIAYLPQMRLEPGLVAKRFGQPAQRIAEAGSDTVHWLYPQSGLDLALDGQGNAVLQYVAPQRFPQLVAPLLQSGKLLP